MVGVNSSLSLLSFERWANKGLGLLTSSQYGNIMHCQTTILVPIDFVTVSTSSLYI